MTDDDPVLTLIAASAALNSGAGIAEVRHEHWPHTVPPHVRAAIALSESAGAPLARVLDMLAADAVVTRDLEAAREAAIAGPRLSGRVLQVLPLAGLGLAALIDARSLTVLVLTPLGWGLLALAAVLTVLGRAWSRAMLRRARDAGRLP